MDLSYLFEHGDVSIETVDYHYAVSSVFSMSDPEYYGGHRRGHRDTSGERYAMSKFGERVALPPGYRTYSFIGQLGNRDRSCQFIIVENDEHIERRLALICKSGPTFAF